MQNNGSGRDPHSMGWMGYLDRRENGLLTRSGKSTHRGFESDRRNIVLMARRGEEHPETSSLVRSEESWILIISRPTRRQEIIICTMCVYMCMRACHTVFSETTTVTHFW